LTKKYNALKQQQKPQHWATALAVTALLTNNLVVNVTTPKTSTSAAVATATVAVIAKEQ
jgi:hypothetical protein